ncbi:MAG: DEAD/DEAH box helicase, partial [Acidimicrobiia bacterium]|nr:DEAD/DEAH box helicase [Acidimicrobiia bacterium]
MPADLVSVLRARDIVTPSPIQAAAVPDALAGVDVCGRAPTGSGKTLAFGLAMVARLSKTAPGRPSGLVLVPTRELAAQVAAELAPLAAARRRRVLSVYGGTGYAAQRKALQRGSDIVVATPGRLEDLLTAGHLRLSDVAVIVVDEADRMADMGFLPAVRR